MAKQPTPSNKQPKQTRAEKRAAKKAAKAQSPGRIKQLGQAYTMTKQHDPKVGLVLLLAFVLGFALGFALLLLIFPSSLVFPIITGLLTGVLAALVVFNRRAMRSAYARVEGQPGAAAGSLEMTLRRGWKIDPAIAVNRQQDVVTRLVGRPGIVLIGEGNPHRLKQLMLAERRRHARVAREVPIHEVVVGYDEGEVPLPKLSRHVRKTLPKKLKPGEMTDVLARIKAIDANRSVLPVPKGPLPTSMKGMRGNMRGR
jgi:hypothetical protein